MMWYVCVWTACMTYICTDTLPTASTLTTTDISAPVHNSQVWILYLLLLGRRE